MKILSLDVTEFGKLKNFSLELDGKMNVIEGNNESGKSTLLLFVSYILYGLPRSSRKGAPDAYDKQRSLSWENKRAAGSMTLEHNGRRLKIERENQKRTTSSVARVTDIDTGEELSFSDEVGEELLGIGRDTFESCLWCAQSRNGVIKGDDLSKTLSNLSLTADESIDGDAALAVLRRERKRYKLERGDGGIIYDLECEIRELRERKAQVDAELAESYEMRELRTELEQSLEKAEKSFKEISACKKTQETVAILGGFRRLEEDEAKLTAAKDELSLLKRENGYVDAEPDGEVLARLRMLISDEVEKSEIFERTVQRKPEPPRVDEKALRIAERISARFGAEEAKERVAERISAEKRSSVTGIILLVLAVACAAVGIIFMPAFFIAAVAVAVAVVFLILSKKKGTELSADLKKINADKENYRGVIDYCFTQLETLKNEKERAEALYESRVESAKSDLERTCAQLFDLLRRYGREGEAKHDLVTRLDRFLKRREDIRRRIMLVSSFVERDKKQLEGQDKEKLLASLPENVSFRADIDRASIEKEYARAEADQNELKSRLTEVRIKLSAYTATPDMSIDLKEKLEGLYARYAEAKRRYNVLTLAMEATDTAYTNMRRDFAPKIRKSASENLAKISDGKYTKIFMNEDFGMSIDVFGSEREVGNFSTGASDAAYLALRLALVENIFDESMPMFLDETLSSLDDTRATAALRLLDEYVKNGGQCLLFSCHKRDANFAESLGIEFKKIVI